MNTEERKNVNLQLIFEIGIPSIGLILSFILRKIIIVFVFFWLGMIISSIFHFCGKIYGKGHWFGKIYCYSMGFFYFGISMLVLIFAIIFCPEYFKFLPGSCLHIIQESRISKFLMQHFWKK